MQLKNDLNKAESGGFSKYLSDCISFFHRFRDKVSDNWFLLTNFFVIFKKHIHNLYFCNLKLALFHFRNRDINDALLRLNIMHYVFRMSSDELIFYKSLCHLFNGKYKTSLDTMKNVSNIEEYAYFLDYLCNYKTLLSIPEEITLKYFDISHGFHHLRYFNKNGVSLYDVSTQVFMDMFFIQKDSSQKLTKNYSLLEIGGLPLKEDFVSVLMNRVFLNYDLVKMDDSPHANIDADNYQKKMFFERAFLFEDVMRSCYKKDKFTNSLIESIPDHKKYNFIVSFDTLSYNLDLTHSLHKVKSHLASDGFFVLVLPIGNENSLEPKMNRFVYNEIDVQTKVLDSGFLILKKSSIMLDKSNKYIILILR